VKPRRSRAGFYQFLAAQVDRADKVGVLVREMRSGRPAILSIMFNPGAEVLRTAAAKAMVEYARSLKVSK